MFLQKPTKSPITNPPTNPPVTSATPPTNPPIPALTPPPTPLPTQPPRGSILGFVWDDTPTDDGAYGPGDVPMPAAAASLRLCDGDGAPLASTVVAGDGTFAFEGLAAGRYRVTVVPPPPATGDGGGTWEFVAKGVNGGNAAAGRADSDADADGTTDCVAVGAGARPAVNVGMVQRDDGGGVTVSGAIFWDADGDGLRDGGGGGASDNVDAGIVAGIVVDLYDCSAEDAPLWLLLTRTDAAGRYTFPADLGPYLDRRGVTGILVKVNLPLSTSGGYAFAPPSRDSDVDPASGRTACWDVNVDGSGAVVWNAGITAAIAPPPPTTVAPTAGPTVRPTVRLTAGPTTEPSAARPVPAGPKTTTTTTSSPTGTSGIVGGYAFFDANDDGVRDSGDGAATNVNVRLFSCSLDAEAAAVPERLLAVDRTDGEHSRRIRAWSAVSLQASSLRRSIRPAQARDSTVSAISSPGGTRSKCSRSRGTG